MDKIILNDGTILEQVFLFNKQEIGSLKYEQQGLFLEQQENNKEQTCH